MESITEFNDYILFNINATSYFNDNVDNNDDVNADQPLWSIFLDRSQLFMVIIGVIANVGTSITLIKNGQVGMVSISYPIVGQVCVENLRFSSDTLTQRSFTVTRVVTYFLLETVSLLLFLGMDDFMCKKQV